MSNLQNAWGSAVLSAELPIRLTDIVDQLHKPFKKYSEICPESISDTGKKWCPDQQTIHIDDSNVVKYGGCTFSSGLICHQASVGRGASSGTIVIAIFSISPDSVTFQPLYLPILRPYTVESPIFKYTWQRSAGNRTEKRNLPEYSLVMPMDVIRTDIRVLLSREGGVYNIPTVTRENNYYLHDHL